MKNTALLFFLISTLFVKESSAQNPIIQNILNDVRIDSLTKFVNELSGQKLVSINGVSDTIHSRHKDSPDNEKAFQFIKQKFTEYGLQVDTVQFSSTGKNIVAILPGTLYPGKKYIIGAHYDNMPPFPNFLSAPGADDNASGVSAVLEAARIFSQYSFPFTINFALWDEEEQGLIGSSAWVGNAGSNNDSLLAYINMDMIGWDGNNDSVAEIHTRPIAQSIQLANVSFNCNSLYNINLGAIRIVNPGITASDHASFWNYNYTAITIEEDIQNDFNPYYHTQGDTLGHFNFSFYEKVTKLAYATIATLAIDTDQILEINSNENEFADMAIIFPNPTSGKFQVYNNIISSSSLVLEIRNYLGIKVFSTPITNSGLTIDLTSQPKGIYFVSIFDDEKVMTRKLVMQ